MITIRLRQSIVDLFPAVSGNSFRHHSCNEKHGRKRTGASDVSYKQMSILESERQESRCARTAIAGVPL